MEIDSPCNRQLHPLRPQSASFGEQQPPAQQATLFSRISSAASDFLFSGLPTSGRMPNFQQFYRCFSVSRLNNVTTEKKDFIDFGGKVIMPSSALESLLKCLLPIRQCFFILQVN